MVAGQSNGTRPLVITDPTLLVRHANERLVMMRERKQVAAIPIADVSHLALHGPITLTGAAIARLLDAGVDVSLHSSAGRWRGSILGARSGNVYLLLAQVAGWNHGAKRMQFARPIVASKIAGQRALLKRRGADRGSERCMQAAEKLGDLEKRVWKEEGVETLRGLEGAASAEYFRVFGEMLSEPWTFAGRVRRPPKDPVNALLSYGYTLATAEVSRQLAWAGFDLRIGMIHGLRYGRESLPLDLVEELRAPVVDRFTLGLLNTRQLVEEDFEREEGTGAVRLTSDGRRRYLGWWEELMMERAVGLRNEPEGVEGARRVGRGSQPDEQDSGGKASWRRRIERQVAGYRRFLMDGVAYRPLQASWKRRAERGRGGAEGVSTGQEGIEHGVGIDENGGAS
jgi:CRISPR-associated protein Cas1